MSYEQQHPSPTLSGAALQATFREQTLLETIAAGSVYAGAFSLTVDNTGTVPWLAGTVQLQPTGDPWEATPLELAEAVGPTAPFNRVTFALTLRAPDTVGTFAYGWQLVWAANGQELLRNPAPSASIQVVESCAALAAANGVDNAELRQLRLEVTRLQAELAGTHGAGAKAELHDEIAAAKRSVAQLAAQIEQRMQTMHEVRCG